MTMRDLLQTLAPVAQTAFHLNVTSRLIYTSVSSLIRANAVGCAIGLRCCEQVEHWCVCVALQLHRQTASKSTEECRSSQLLWSVTRSYDSGEVHVRLFRKARCRVCDYVRLTVDLAQEHWRLALPWSQDEELWLKYRLLVKDLHTPSNRQGFSPL